MNQILNHPLDSTHPNAKKATWISRDNVPNLRSAGTTQFDANDKASRCIEPEPIRRKLS